MQYNCYHRFKGVLEVVEVAAPDPCMKRVASGSGHWGDKLRIWIMGALGMASMGGRTVGRLTGRRQCGAEARREEAANWVCLGLGPAPTDRGLCFLVESPDCDRVICYRMSEAGGGGDRDRQAVGQVGQDDVAPSQSCPAKVSHLVAPLLALLRCPPLPSTLQTPPASAIISALHPYCLDPSFAPSAQP